MRGLKRNERQLLEKRDSDRAKIILLYVSGMSKAKISLEIGLHRSCVIEWIKRYEASELDGLKEKKGRGRPTKYRTSQIRRIVNTVCTKPLRGTHRWTVRLLAEKLKIDKDKVHRVLKDFHLYPHLLGTFMFSPDPQFEEKLLEVEVCVDHCFHAS